MFLFRSEKKQMPQLPAVQTIGIRKPDDFPVQLYAYDLFEKVRRTVPIIDAAISKIIRLTGSFQIQCSDPRQQKLLDQFLRDVPVGLTGQSIYAFMDSYLDSLLVFGNAVGEIVFDRECMEIAGLWNGNAADISVRPGASPMERQYFLRTESGERKSVPPAAVSMAYLYCRGFRPLRIFYSGSMNALIIISNVPEIFAMP